MFFSSSLQQFIVALHADIRDRIDSYLPNPESKAAFSNGLNEIAELVLANKLAHISNKLTLPFS